MFNVNGDIIEYDGKPFAVITAGLSGFRMEAVDTLNETRFVTYDHMVDLVSEIVKDHKEAFEAAMADAKENLWLSDELEAGLTKIVNIHVSDVETDYRARYER